MGGWVFVRSTPEITTSWKDKCTMIDDEEGWSNNIDTSKFCNDAPEFGFSLNSTYIQSFFRTSCFGVVILDSRMREPPIRQIWAWLVTDHSTDCLWFPWKVHFWKSHGGCHVRLITAALWVIRGAFFVSQNLQESVKNSTFIFWF